METVDRLVEGDGRLFRLRPLTQVLFVFNGRPNRIQDSGEMVSRSQNIGEGERNWFELKSNKTKKRNRLGKETIEKMMFVRRFLRLERKVLTTTVGATDPILAKWVQRLLKDAAVSLNPDANDAGVPEGGNDEDDMEALTVFNDVIVPKDQVKINGREPGQPRVSLTNLRKDKHAQS